MEKTVYQTRLERILGAPLEEDAVRQWPQSGELIRGRARTAEVESHFEGLRLGVGGGGACGGILVVEGRGGYGDGRVFRDVTICGVAARRRRYSPISLLSLCNFREIAEALQVRRPVKSLSFCCALTSSKTEPFLYRRLRVSLRSACLKETMGADGHARLR